MESTSECFIAGIKALRDHGWQKRDQKEMAKEIGYTPTHIAQVFQGKRNASVKLQDALSEEYGIHTENIIKIGRLILNGDGFFPFFGQIEALPPNSEEQAEKIVKLTNKVYGIDGLLDTYKPKLWKDFLSRNISAIQFYNSYTEELDTIISRLCKRFNS